MDAAKLLALYEEGETDFQELNLENIDLRNADLSGADFSDANFNGVNFSHANLRDTNLAGVNFHDSDLSNADLSYANLCCANAELSQYDCVYIDDCIYGSKMLFESSFTKPINIGSSELVSINQMVEMVESIAGIRLDRIHNLNAPQGVRGRNSDNTLIQKEFSWEPTISLMTGLEKTYKWIYDNLDEYQNTL
jgi:hypothetical protein